jgi:hypothetical protein
MHSLVMTVAIAAEIPSPGGAVQTGGRASGAPPAPVLGGDEEDPTMVRSMIPLLGALLLVAAPVRAEDNPEMNAAQHDLESARSHLQAAPHDYAGHRKAAVEAINRALKDVNEGLKAVAAKEKKVEHKETKAEHRVERLEQRDQQLKR